MNGSPLQQAIKRLIVEVIDEEQRSTGNLRPELGTVLSLNGDGTIAVQTDANHYPNCGAATQDCYVIGLQVMVLCADGMQVAIPSTQSVAVMT
jgi:hypothetical protein